MIEKGFIHKNMYFVNRETDIIHAYFRRNNQFTDINSEPDERCSLGGDIFLGQYDLTLAQLKSVDFSTVADEGGIYDYGTPVFEHVSDIWYPLCKGYRLIRNSVGYGAGLQLYENYMNNDRFELMAFESLLLLRWASDKMINRFMSDETDKYGIFALMNEKFYIAGDDNEDIANCYHFHGILEFEKD
jgi:hypothetical protein